MSLFEEIKQCPSSYYSYGDSCCILTGEMLSGILTLDIGVMHEFLKELSPPIGLS